LGALEKKGYLKRTSYRSRAIELAIQIRAIPIIANIKAGRPDFAYEDIQGYIEPDDLFLGRLSQGDIFGLRVIGDSMVRAGIMEGDIAIIRKQAWADNADIVAALLENNEVTLKILRKKTNSCFLEAANENYQPIYREFSIIGRLITLIRKY